MAHKIKHPDDFPNLFIELEVGLIEEKEAGKAGQKTQSQKRKKKDCLLFTEREFQNDK